MRNLFRNWRRQLKNAVKTSGKRQYFFFFLLGAGMLSLMGFVFIKVFAFLYYQKEFPDVFKLFLSEKILMMAFLTMFIMLVLSALVSTLNIFFLSRDLTLLLSSPLSSRTVFLWKTMEVGSSSALMVIFFSLPVLFSYSYYFAPGIGNIAAIVLVFLLYIVCGVLTGIIIGMIIPAFFSIKKLQPVLSLVSIFLMSAIVIFLRLLRPEQFGNPEVINNILNYMSGLKVGFLSYFPFSWLSKALNALASGEPLEYWKIVGAFLGVIFILAAATRFVQKNYYLKLYDKLNKGSRGGYKSTWKRPLLVRGTYAPLWRKEIKTFMRTPSQWSQLLIIGAIIIVFILNIKGIDIPHPSVKNIIAYLNLGMAAFIVSGLNSRFTFTSIPMETPGIIHLLASPFKRRGLVHFKLLFFMIPQMVIGFVLFFTGDISLRLDAFARFSGVVYLLPVLPFLTALSLFYSLKVKDSVPLTPPHLISTKNGISSMLWSMVYIVAGMVYFVRPLFLYYYNRFREREIPVAEISIWFGAFLLVNIIMLVLIYRRSLSLWDRHEFTVN
ncbi:MAG: hypothetical protein GY950_08560 [bacterium]|nr:hypothetical protein [bacterium]